MKTRVIVGISLALVAIGGLVAMGFGIGEVLIILIVLISGLCMHEIMNVSGNKNKVLTGISIVYAVGLSCLETFKVFDMIPYSRGVLFGTYILAMFVLMLKMYENTRFEHVVISIFCSTAIPEALVCLLRTGDLCEAYPDLLCRSNCIFISLMAMYCAWLCDSFALFAGKAFGKHKMSPKISPKKTYEGAIGGIVGTTVFAMITFFICDHFYFITDTIKWWMVLILVPIGCIIGMCGDLSASVIKRNYGVKDFGTLLPEHGGAMDRTDSFLFTMPATYIICEFILKAAQ